ncbi:DnaG: DNA primase [Desulfosarcina variabilis str. Montpellier]|uniref:DNA primase n=1 Tax=Desulfosarcina variabilis TaxID=2300 RepID=UPI003AFA80E3
MAAYIPDDKILSIKNASDIVDIISESVALRRTGRNFVGLCPFHAEKTPSFTVSPDKQIFYCFGCGAGGNIFSFVMKHEGLSFPEAARSLARRYGIDLPTRNLSPHEKKKLTEREMILTLNKEAMAFYQDCLIRKPAGRHGMAYLLKRGMNKSTIEDYKLGFAPEGWDHLLRYIRSRKKPLDLALKAGLIIPRKSGSGFYDRFRNRITFPIFDGQNQLLGFGGRVMDDALPKYLNSPDTPVYNKSHSLYGLHCARQQCRKTRTVYVVEGYFDLLAMHQFGMQNTVATLGTALTASHVQMLKGYVGSQGKAILVYDSDQAGVKAAQRSVTVFQKGLLEARILVLPKGHDPDSFLMAHGPEKFLLAAEKAMHMMTFMVETAVEKYGLGIDGKVRIVNDLKSALLAIDDPVARSLQVKYLAERIDVKESAILQKVRQPIQNRTRLPDDHRQKRGTNATPVRGETYRLEQKMVTMMLQFPEMVEVIAQRQLMDNFTDPLLADVGRGIIENLGKAGGDVASLLSQWDEPERKAAVARLCLADEHWDRSGCMNLINQFENSTRRRDNVLLKRIQAAEKNGDQDLLAELLKQKQHQALERMGKKGGH